MLMKLANKVQLAKQKFGKCKNEAEERVFWQNHSMADFINDFKLIDLDLSELKPTIKKTCN